MAAAFAAGCQPIAPPRPAAAPELTELPALQSPGAIHYRIDGGNSEVLIYVYRGGPLARYGHNHVLRATRVEGDVYLATRFAASGFMLHLFPESFDVDPEDARAAAGEEFASRPSPEAVAATRTNLLGAQVLDAARYPEITIRSVRLTGPEPSPTATVRITLHGTARDLDVPLSIDRGGGRLQVSGEFSVLTSNFGMVPFSVLGGGLRVEDEVSIRFMLTAVRD